MKFQKLIVTILLSFACVTPTYSCMLLEPLLLTLDKLKEYGCVLDHAKLQVKSEKSDLLGVLKIAERLKREGLLNKKSLYLKAEALFKLERFNEALDAYLLSQRTPTVCDFSRGNFGKCGFSLFQGYRTLDGKEINEKKLFKLLFATSDHYELAKYYQAAGRLYEAHGFLIKDSLF